MDLMDQVDLMERVCDRENLIKAYKRVRANKGAPGVDGMTVEELPDHLREHWPAIREQLMAGTYKPQPVKRVEIPKPGGGERPLGIPTIRDRVVQTATKLVVEPIFEADLEPNVHGYRPKRSALDAIQQVHKLLKQGYTDVVDADLSKYFDTIPHQAMMQCVSRRIVDRNVLRLIKLWLKTPVVHDDGKGRGGKVTGGRKSTCGTPQGGVISPLLANVYMNRFLKYWRMQRCDEVFRAHVVSYADDFVILSRGKAEQALEWTTAVMERLGLRLNETKTVIRDGRKETFNFLGYTFGRCYSTQDGHAYIGTRPSKQSVQKLCREISEATSRRRALLDAETVVKGLNRKLIGWANYFCLGPVSKAYRTIDQHASARLRRWLCKKHKQSSRGTRRYPDAYLYETLGLQRLSVSTRNLPWAKA